MSIIEFCSCGSLTPSLIPSYSSIHMAVESLSGLSVHCTAFIFSCNTRRILTSLDVIIEQGDSFEIIDVMSPSSNGKRITIGQLTAIRLAGYEAIKKGKLFMDIFIAVYSAILPSKYRLAIIIKAITSDTINGIFRKTHIFLMMIAVGLFIFE
ncbi:uncharacterized protein BX664DRAFT_317803 [Halteromyces radiatus]|uniref:uncharacterized protein n=1 Tax=Halteromyces radiatus TaxID=101107 RepID=UPI00221E690A|nr:uncharacterized protein BX664DRAFT_317803 [Halteromyces radiatus]KAI8079911.1 hypothetical protein BX664DRAFT_317803 [Halteromyces radiatus]